MGFYLILINIGYARRINLMSLNWFTLAYLVLNNVSDMGYCDTRTAWYKRLEFNLKFANTTLFKLASYTWQ